jgi:hypothetical protein
MVAEDGGGRHHQQPQGLDYYHQESLLAMQEQHDQTTGGAIKATIPSHPTVVNKPAGEGQTPPPLMLPSPPSGVTATAKNVTVAHGKTALLTCKVGAGLLDNRTVKKKGKQK